MPEASLHKALDQISPEEVLLFEHAEQRHPEWGLDWFHLLANHALAPNEQAGFISSLTSEPTNQMAVLPCKITPATGQIAALSTFYTTLFSPICEPGTSPQALTALFGRLKLARWSTVTLAPMRLDDAQFEATLNSLRSAGWRAYPYFSFGNWYQTTTHLTFDAYFQNRSSQVRNTVKRRKKKFVAGARGRLELVDHDNLERAIQIWTEIYNASWKIPEPFPEFMPELIRLCARKGWLRMAIAYYDQTPIAAQIWIVHQKRAAIYKLAYDEKYAQHSAGTLLTVFLMQHVLDIDQVNEVDYLIGDEPYKQDWVSQRRECWGIVAYNPVTLRGLVGWFRESAGRAIKPLLKARKVTG